MAPQVWAITGALVLSRGLGTGEGRSVPPALWEGLAVVIAAPLSAAGGRARDPTGIAVRRQALGTPFQTPKENISSERPPLNPSTHNSP